MATSDGGGAGERFRSVYLDHAATTPVRREVAEAMAHYMLTDYGNASSVHSFGRRAAEATEEARARVADLMGARPEEVVFMSGGTEADNMSIRGSLAAYSDRGRHVVTTKIEHHAVLHTCEELEKEGLAEVTYLPVDRTATVDPDDVAKAIRPDTVLVSVMFANNEVGTIQPIMEIGRTCREKGVLFHTDAVQAFGAVPFSVDEMGIDLMSVSSHKLYGPKGVGALYVRKGRRIRPLIHGGGHERKRRAGTSNVPGVVGFGLAAELARKEMDDRVRRLTALRDRLIDGLLGRVEFSHLNGHPTRRLPNNVNVSFEFVEGESILLSLDKKGIAASSGSACTSGSLEPSHVLLAMGIPPEVAHGSVRMTLGTQNTDEDVDYVLEVLPGVIERLRAMSPLHAKAVAERAREAAGRPGERCESGPVTPGAR
ncbi:MAG: cysteine desulfurase NifS [Bacillota bacterium]|nr:MAG: cysteine desulfurase NifS [Bacillota bacterium]